MAEMKRKGKTSNVSIITACLIAILIFVNSWPAFTGNLFESNILAKEIPDYWYEAANWLNLQSGDFRTFSLPEQYFAVYDWGYPYRDISTTLFKTKSQILLEPGAGYANHTVNLQNFAYKLVTENATGDVLSKVLGLMNVKYIVQRNDVDWAFYNVDPPERVRSILMSQPGIYLERQYGKLDFYRNEYVVPHIYATNNLLYADGGLELLTQLASIDEFDFKASATFFSDIQPKERETVLPLATEEWRVIKFNPDKINRSKNQEIIFLERGGTEEWEPNRFFMYDPYWGNFFAEGSRGYIDQVNVFVKNTETSSQIAEIGFSISPGDSEVFSVDVDIPSEGVGWFSAKVNRYWESDSLFVYIKRDSLLPYYIAWEYVDLPHQRFYSQDKGKTWEEIQASPYIDVDFKTLVSRTLQNSSGITQEITPVYKKHNPTLYTVRMNASRPFFLVFSEAYDEGWGAFIEGKSIEEHFLVNAYANGWYVDKTGDFTITLRYRPQHSRNIGYIISITAVVASIIFPVLLPRFGKRWRKNYKR